MNLVKGDEYNLKIGKLILKNFAAIYAGMKVKKIEINFFNASNEITLLVGPNGSGKTAILSNLHPFAYVGSMDVRNSLYPILEGEDGYKEIEIWKDDVAYLIKHYYKPTKTGGNVKSYIMKDTVEMNPNGNVTSFEEIVSVELGVTKDYMQLIRIGSNVINFGDMKTSQRKEYITDLMKDIDVYSKLYKKINDDKRFLKASLTDIVRKLERLHILDVDDEEHRILSLQETKESNIKNLEEAKKVLWSNRAIIKEAMPQGENIFINTLNENQNQYSLLVKKIENIGNKLEKYSDVSNLSSKDIKKMKKDKDIFNNEIISAESTIKANNSSLDRLYTSLDDRREQLNRLQSASEYEELKKAALDMRCRILAFEDEKHFNTISYKCTKADMLLALSILQEINKIAQDISEIGVDSVKLTIDMIRNKKNVEGFVAHKVATIDDKLAKLTTPTIQLDNSVVKVLFIPQGCPEGECPFFNMYNNQSDKKDNKDKIIKLENEREKYVSMLNIYKKIEYISMMVKSNTQLNEKLPENFFNMDSFLSAIYNFLPLYDEDNITNYITLLEEYEEYNSLKCKLNELEKDLKYIKQSHDSYLVLQKEYESIEGEISVISDEIALMNKQIETARKHLSAIELIEKRLDEFDELKEELSEYMKTCEDLKKSIDNDLKNLDRLRDNINKEKELNNLINRLENDNKKIDDDIMDIRFRIKDFKTFNKEIKDINEKFEEIDLIKRSLSSNEGIPLLAVQVYFKNTKKIVNELLEVAYHGRIEMDDFIIDDKTFGIPYYKNGLRVNDIAYASDGERAIFCIALSFALMIQTGCEYNIMLLDEVDGPLDKDTRERFIDILEAQMQTIHAENVFAITHNNNFENYPVNLVCTEKTSDIERYKNINIIPIIK